MASHFLAIPPTWGVRSLAKTTVLQKHWVNHPPIDMKSNAVSPNCLSPLVFSQIGVPMREKI